MFELDKRIMFTFLPFLLFIPNFVYSMKNSRKFASVGNTQFVKNKFVKKHFKDDPKISEGSLCQ